VRQIINRSGLHGQKQPVSNWTTVIEVYANYMTDCRAFEQYHAKRRARRGTVGDHDCGPWSHDGRRRAERHSAAAGPIVVRSTLVARLPWLDHLDVQ
jgi:hypothetical protein